MSKLILPRKFEDRTGEYPQHVGKNKLSYSQYTSWNDPNYKFEYIKQYFAGIELKSGIFADVGSDAGEHIEWIGRGRPSTKPKLRILNQSDLEIIERVVDFPSNCIYEDLVVVDCGDFVVEGYTDRTEHKSENVCFIRDYKTGGIKKKASFYASEDYGQTQLYGLGKNQKGLLVEGTEVFLLDRAGNGSAKSPIRLTGETLIINIPYSRDKAEKLVENMRKTAYDISDYFKTYQKIFG